MRYRNHSGNEAIQVVPYGVRESVQHMEANPIFIRRPHVRSVDQPVNRFKHLGTKRIRSDGTSIEVPQECLSELPLSIGENLNDEPGHIALMRARTSAHGAPLTTPLRSWVRRSSSSARQASATEPSSAVSRLSMRAAATAERSSAESRRTSSSTWSMRAFMCQSIASNGAPPAPPNLAFKRSANGRPPRPGVWYFVHLHTPGLGALPSSPA
jgi:hypothetical protein